MKIALVLFLAALVSLADVAGATNDVEREKPVLRATKKRGGEGRKRSQPRAIQEPTPVRGANSKNWHQWRGPLNTGVAPEADPPLNWDDETNIQWKVPIEGNGESTPIVWETRVFLLTAVRTDREEPAPPKEEPTAPGGNPFKIQRPKNFYQFVVRCHDRATGNLLWESVATEQVPHEGHHRDHGFASASPTTDGERLYVSFGSRGIYCFDMDGNQLWSRDLGDLEMYRFFGEASSPVYCDGVLFVNWDHEGDSFLYALDAATGATKWQVARDEEHSSWATPAIARHAGRTQVVVNGMNKARGYDFETGKVLWECGGQTLAVIPTPVIYKDLVLCMSGYPASALFAIPLGSTGDISGSDAIAWHRKRDTPYCPSPLLLGERLWFNKSNGSVLTCVEAATGTVVLEGKRLPGIRSIYASPVAAAGRIYFTGRDGTTVVLADTDKLEVLAQNSLDDTFDASPALVGDQIFLRGEEHLYAIGQGP